tara:strand:- start:349 stop:549 length:201 start_codon:yes stop_codon:yes gene_type:complete
MTVQQLIEKLQTLNSNDEVIVEENHGEYYRVEEERIISEMMTEDDGFLNFACDEDTNGKMMVVIRL